MEIVPLCPGFAAELRGVTIHDVAASESVCIAVRTAFEEHSVLVLRDQDVSDEAQLAFSRFGPLEVTKVGSAGYGSNLVVLKTLDENGNVVSCERCNYAKEAAGWRVSTSIDETRTHTAEFTTPTGKTHRSTPPPRAPTIAFGRLELRIGIALAKHAA